MIASCTHLGEIRKVTPSADGCEDCLKIGDTISSLEPGEDWGWCYADELFIEPADLRRALAIAAMNAVPPRTSRKRAT